MLRKCLTKKVEKEISIVYKTKIRGDIYIFLKENNKLGHFYPALEPFMIEFDVKKYCTPKRAI